MDESSASIIEEANAVLYADGRLGAAEEFFTPSYVTHVTDRDMKVGPDGVRRYLGAVRDAFENLSVEVEILVEEGDRVAWVRTVRGTQVGSFEGFPASGRNVVWRDMVTSRLENGRIAEEWVVTDLAERLLRTRKG